MSLDLPSLVVHYRAHGYAIVEGLLPAEWCDTLIAAAQALPSARDGSGRSEMNVHLRGGIFERTMAHPDIVATVDALVGGAASGLQSQFFFRPPGTEGFHPHQDNFYVETDPDCFASAWLSLVDVSAGNGGLYLFPGTHREGRLPVRVVEDEDFDTRAGVREMAAVPPHYRRVAPDLPRGSVVFIHGQLVHGSYANDSDAGRYALLNTYLRPGTPFRVGRTGGRREFPLRRAPSPGAASSNP